MINRDFFTNFFQFCEGNIEIRPIPGESAFFEIKDLVGVDSYCQRFKDSNLYFGVATRDGIERIASTGEPTSEIADPKEITRGGKHNVVSIPAVWADVDFKITPREIIAQKLKEFPFRPSVTVKSGGGVHLYWLLKEPAEKSDISSIEGVNHRIADALGGDHNACDAARILRVPGTKNRKYNPAPLCEVVQQNDFHYTLDDFLEILPESSHKNQKKSQNKNTNDPNWLFEAMKGAEQGNRNGTGTKIAGYFINKVSPSDVLSILKSWNLNNKPPLDNKEIETIAKSVSRYQPDLSVKHKVDISNVYDSARMIEEYKAYIKTLKQNRFITGIKQIDKRIRGVAGGEVLTIIARSGSFKTAMLQNLLKNYIDHSAWAAAFFSIEMPVASLAERYLEILDGCTGQEVETLFTDPDRADIRDNAERSFTRELNKLLVVPTRVSLSDIAAYVRLIECEKSAKIGVIGIDYMGLMEGPGVSEYEIISRLSTGLKSTAKLLNIPVIVLAQVSRKGMSGSTEISLDMGRGSGAIEEAADFVLGLWQGIGEGGKKELICKILKNRKGPAGSRWRLDLVPHALYIGPNAEPYQSAEKTTEGY